MASEEKVWERLLTLWSFGTWIFDFLTDVITVEAYWTHQSETVALLASISLGLSIAVGISVIKITLYVLEEGERHDYQPLVTVKCIETLVESIPQLCINFYVLASCDEGIQPIQYVSAFGSFTGACKGIISFDKMVAKSIKESQQPLGGDTSNNHAENARGETANRRDRTKSKEEYDWLDTLLLFITKCFALISKVFILAYFAFYLGWWTALAVMYRSVFFILWYFCTESIDNDLSDKQHVMVILVFVISKFVWYTFVWSGDAKLGKWSTLLLALFYSIENGVLLAISLHERIFPEPYCLYFEPLGINAGLNISTVVCALLFTWKREGQNETFKKMEKKGSKIGKGTKKQILACFACANKVKPGIDNDQDQPMEIVSVSQFLDM